MENAKKEVTKDEVHKPKEKGKKKAENKKQL